VPQQFLRRDSEVWVLLKALIEKITDYLWVGVGLRDRNGKEIRPQILTGDTESGIGGLSSCTMRNSACIGSRA
jgi:hypothetical protein